jgi:uncharacterized MAPEG superfamily protein
VLTLTALTAKATGLSLLQVVARLKARTFPIPEDARLMKIAPSGQEAPFVARCANVWRNDVENVPLFLTAALGFTLLGGGARQAAWLFGLFVAVRFIHTIVYLRGLQPWRAVAYLTGMALTWSVIVCSLRLLLPA